MVAAATGAGYAAKYCKNLVCKEGEVSSQSLSFCSVQRQSDYTNLLKQIWDQSTPLQRLALRKLHKDGFFMDDGKDLAGSSSNLHPLTGEKGSSQDTSKVKEGKSNYFSDISRPLRSRYYGNSLEPLYSCQNCLEDHLYSLLPNTAARPLLLTEESEINSKNNADHNEGIQMVEGVRVALIFLQSVNQVQSI